jgi:polyferredoxin
MESAEAKMAKLVFLKRTHTAVWVFFNILMAYLFYAVWAGRTGLLFWICVGCFIAEFLVLMFNGWACPITPMARKYTDDQRANFDIYLPEWLARHNKTIYSALFIMVWVVYLFRWKGWL